METDYRSEEFKRFLCSNLGTKGQLSLDGKLDGRWRALLKDSEHPSEEAALGFFSVKVSNPEPVVFECERPGRLEMR